MSARSTLLFTDVGFEKIQVHTMEGERASGAMVATMFPGNANTRCNNPAFAGL